MRTIHPFNMVEVALALLVISLGLSTVLTLFPAGLKATSEAETANDVAEAAEYIFGYFQTLGTGNIHVVSSADDRAITTGPSSISRIEEIGENSGLYVYRKTIHLDSGYGEDFNCVVQFFDARHGTWCNSDNSEFVYFPDRTGHAIAEEGSRTSSNTYYFTGSTTVSQSGNFHAYDVELSYPATVTRERRTKRTYRMVFLE